MRSYYLVKVSKEHLKTVEKVFIKAICDRYGMVSLYKSFILNTHPNDIYFVIGGEKHSCKIVLVTIKELLKKKNIPAKMYLYESMKITGLNNLIWCEDKSELGEVIKNYHGCLEYEKNLVDYVNKFMVNKGYQSKLKFCECCEGYCSIVKLTSAIGIYRCDFCGTENIAKGALLNQKSKVLHLSPQEQLYMAERGLEFIESRPNIVKTKSTVMVKEDISTGRIVHKKSKGVTDIPIIREDIAVEQVIDGILVERNNQVTWEVGLNVDLSDSKKAYRKTKRFRRMLLAIRKLEIEEVDTTEQMILVM